MAAAETIPGPATEEIARLAKELDIYVIFGMPERDANDPNLRYISVAVVGPEGILGSYRKIHLGGPPRWTETYCFQPGNSVPVFVTKYGPIGIQICADFWHFPELSRILAFKGARMIFNPSGSGVSPGKVDMMTYGTAARGMEVNAYIISVNHVGKEKTISYYGHSTIAGPQMPRFCKIYAQGGDDEEIVWATLNFEALEYTRSISTLKRGEWQLIAGEYQELLQEQTR